MKRFIALFVLIALALTLALPALAGDGQCHHNCKPKPKPKMVKVCLVEKNKTVRVPFRVALKWVRSGKADWGECPEIPAEPQAEEDEHNGIPGPPHVVIGVWSVEGTSFTWEHRNPDGGWSQVQDADGDPIVTPVEYRLRYNKFIDAEEYAAFTRLVNPVGADTDPNNYRAFNAETGEMTGVWVEYQDEWCQETYEQICGVHVYIGP